MKKTPIVTGPPPSIYYAASLFRQNPKKVRIPLPVSVFCWRISGSSFGFLTGADRDIAAKELAKQFLTTNQTHQDNEQPHVSFTPYKDTQAFYAAQIIVWSAGNVAGGFHFNSRGRLVSAFTRKETPVESIIRPRGSVFTVARR